jgi:hypothetical protein
MLRAVTQCEEAIGPKISKDELTNGAVDLVKTSMRSNTKACHVMDQRSTNERMTERLMDTRLSNEGQLGGVQR